MIVSINNKTIISSSSSRKAAQENKRHRRRVNGASYVMVIWENTTDDRELGTKGHLQSRW